MARWGSLSEAEHNEELEDVSLDMELHEATVEYCIMAFQEFVEEEEQNEKIVSAQASGLLQQRLAASLAGRVTHA